MKYRVTIVPHAKRQLLELALWWSKHRSAAQAFDWLEGFEKLLGSLAKSPERHQMARENAVFDRELRELYFGLSKKPTHRAVFEIRESDVIVHSIRHLAQADLTLDDI